MLEGYFLDLAWLLGALFFGVMLGSLTGLIPGFHVNNVALILLALSPALLDLGIPLASVAAIIVATGTVHTFLNIAFALAYAQQEQRLWIRYPHAYSSAASSWLLMLK